MSRMIRKKEKLKINDINKNSGKEVSHTINKIKENERKYTIILVIFFMVLFGVVGYYTLRVDNTTLGDSLNEVVSDNLSSSSQIVILTKNNIKTDNEGLNGTDYTINITNNSLEIVNYKIKLVSDTRAVTNCNCADRLLPVNMIRYSLNNKNIQILSLNSNNEMIITTGSIKSGKTKKLKINMWVSDTIDSTVDYHFHGYFKVEKVENLNN